jgi:predicted anti-sigma-YlaC factor YlaD
MFRFPFKRRTECAQVRELASFYLEKDLQPSLMERIKKHLDQCHLCTAFVRSLAATMRMLSETEAPQPAPAGFTNRILRKVRDQKTNKD